MWIYERGKKNHRILQLFKIFRWK